VPRNKPTDPRDPAAVRARALRLLARREHGARELEYKLAQRGIAREQAAEVVGELAQVGWQSDERYVRSLVRTRVAQGFGPLRIESELEGAGVADSLIRASLAAAEADWKALAVEIHARKFRHAPKNGPEWQKQYRHLAGRGFDTEQIYAALKGEPPAQD
ncbi:MAG TPA: regulatory protein RecX, partial [Nevskia sp.]|nr:regulatory protein RecX [Nevskia sp.]